MLNIYTVSFFGHRYIDNASEVEQHLDCLLHDLIVQKEYVVFLVGRDGDFDTIASAAIKRAIHSYGYGNAHFILMLPYMKAEYRDNEKEFLDYYDEVEVCAESSEAHPKSAIQVRNRCMVDRSDLVVCCIQHKSGGAYKTVQYAVKQGKQVRNLSDCQL
ncbi:MAG: hypothetical protein IK999_08510 [Ruminococcus sp.]|nr:hypothetical protein [Ruminococcus sp.]